LYIARLGNKLTRLLRWSSDSVGDLSSRTHRGKYPHARHAGIFLWFLKWDKL